MMNIEEAKRVLLIHSGFIVDPEKPGLLGRLRPYEGIDEVDMAEIVEAVVAWRPQVQASREVDKAIVAALWHLCVQIDVLALRPDAPIRHRSRLGQLISEVEVARLAKWTSAFKRLVGRILQDLDLESCISPMFEYISDEDNPHPAAYFALKDCMLSALEYDDQDYVMSARAALRAIQAD